MSNDNQNKETRRGFDPKDELWFSEEAIKTLQMAQEELIWLLDRGYKLSSAMELIGGHYQLSARQRMAIQRASCSTSQVEKRMEKLQHIQALDDCVYIDGFNLIITLEVALSGSILLLCRDGCLRDMAGLRGTYRLIDKTDIALQLIGKGLNSLSVSRARFLLDSPVSNSGRLKSRILEHAEKWGLAVEAELVTNPDSMLSSLRNVITTDSVILDSCISWINLSKKIVEDYIKSATLIDLSCNK